MIYSDIVYHKFSLENYQLNIFFTTSTLYRFSRLDIGAIQPSVSQSPVEVATGIIQCINSCIQTQMYPYIIYMAPLDNGRPCGRQGKTGPSKDLPHIHVYSAAIDK